MARCNLKRIEEEHEVVRGLNQRFSCQSCGDVPVPCDVVKLARALDECLADYDERVGLYGEREKKPNRERVMEQARRVLVEVAGEKP